MNTKAQIDESVKSSINEIIKNLSSKVDEKTKEDSCDPETLVLYTKALMNSLCAAQRFDFVTGKYGEIIDIDTERMLKRTVGNITELVLKTCVSNQNVDDLLNFIRKTLQLWRIQSLCLIVNPVFCSSLPSHVEEYLILSL